MPNYLVSLSPNNEMSWVPFDMSFFKGSKLPIDDISDSNPLEVFVNTTIPLVSSERFQITTNLNPQELVICLHL
jgi:hypothetical protein